MKVYLSGVHSDPDPSPGLGIARSLRSVFPSVHLVGVDYSVGSSGLHHRAFDDIWVQPSWDMMDLQTYEDQIRRQLSAPKTCWISGLDVEVAWLAERVGPLPNLLIPTKEARASVEKPRISVAADMGMTVPEWLPAGADSEAVHALGRRHGWRLWVKGRYHEALPARGFEAVGDAFLHLADHWPLADVFVQAHVAGHERAYTFCAFEGELLEAVFVEKRLLSIQGKTWGAAVSRLEGEPRERLAALVRRIGWTGGGEVEYIHDGRGANWLIDFNPRFPAYVHGVTLCGANLPALLVARVLGLNACPQPPAGQTAARQFIRVVEEIEVRRDLFLPNLAASRDGVGVGGKHPSRQPALVRARKAATDGRASKPPPRTIDLNPRPVDDEATRRVLALAVAPGPTPRRVRDIAALDEALEATLRAASAGPIPIRPCVSVKTDPAPDVIGRAIARGWLPETISAAEARHAVALGAAPANIVLNGPLAAAAAEVLAREFGTRLKVAFADSLEAFDRLLTHDCVATIGFRLRAPSIASRFGIDPSRFEVFCALVDRIAASSRPYGIHFHHASDTVGPDRWFDVLDEALAFSAAIAQTAGRGPSIFDVGGGWHHVEYRQHFLPRLAEIGERVQGALSTVEEVLIEPGKAIASSSGLLVTDVVEARGKDREAEIVVDASIADMPMAPLYSHRILHIRSGRALGWLGFGTARVLGSICMETDILARAVSFPDPPSAGDRLVFADAGAYNASMAWPFAEGRDRDADRVAARHLDKSRPTP